MRIIEIFLQKIGLRKKWDWPISKKAVKYYDDHRNFYIEKYKLIFFRVSKVAGTSLWQKSAELLGYQDISRENLPNLNIPKVSGLDIENYGNQFRASFVRNPWDRLLSCYLQKKAYKRVKFFERNGIDQNLTFEEFVMKVCSIPDEKADQHFRSQFMTLVNHRGEFMLDFLGQFEFIDRDYSILTDLVGLQNDQLPKTNKTKHESYEKYYTPSMQKATAERYALDLKLFQYQFGEKTSLVFNDLIKKTLDDSIRLEILKVKCAKMVEVIKRIQLEEGLKKTGLKYKIKDYFLKYSLNIKQHELEPYDDHRNIYIEKYKMMFYKIPKVASTSLWEIGVKLLGKPYSDQKTRGIALPYIPFYQIKEREEVKKIGFVRNPWCRILSCFVQKKKDNRKRFFQNMGIDKNISFADFVEVVCNTPDHKVEKHLRSQFSYLIDHASQWLTDYIGRFDTFNEDINFILKEKGIDNIEIPHNNSSEILSCQKYYTPELIEKVRERYAIDIELFGFEYGSLDTRNQNRIFCEEISDELKLKILEYKSEKLMKVLRKMSISI